MIFLLWFVSIIENISFSTIEVAWWLFFINISFINILQFILLFSGSSIMPGVKSIHDSDGDDMDQETAESDKSSNEDTESTSGSGTDDSSSGTKLLSFKQECHNCTFLINTKCTHLKWFSEVVILPIKVV